LKLTPKVRKTLDFATRLIIATLSLSFIFYRIYSVPASQVNTFVNTILGNKQLVSLCIVLVLFMIVNWGIESWKWKLLISQSEKISIVKAYQAILGGLAVSIFTPNRVGEFMGRVFILQKTEPLKAILLTIVGSFSQILITLVFGTVAYLFLAPGYLPQSLGNITWLIRGFSITLLSLSVGMILIYFNISVLHRVSILIPARFSERVQQSIDAIAGCPQRLLLKAVLLSSVRYLVFSTQFFIALRLMGLNFAVWQCMMVIPVIYLFLAAIPTIALSEIGVRGSVSVFLFGLLVGSNGLNPADSLAVISASTLIWLLNIAVPSLAGVIVIFRLKFFRR
jgi:uncharacterized membrane protein YbhN (UPF0104 family)